MSTFVHIIGLSNKVRRPLPGTVGRSWCPWQHWIGAAVHLLPLDVVLVTGDAPAGPPAKSSLLIGQVFTNQHIMASLAYKEELMVQGQVRWVGAFPASPPVTYNGRRAPVQAP